MHDQRRQLPQRDHAPRARDPARAVAARDSRTTTSCSGAGRRAAAATGATAIFPPPADRPHEWEILARLGWLCTGGTQRRLRLRRRSTTAASPRCADRRGSTPRTTIAALRRAAARSASSTSRSAPDRGATATARCPTGSRCEKIKAQPHGIDMGPMVPRAREMVCTPDGMIELAPAYIVGDLPRLRARDRASPTTASVLVSRRHLRSKNSWMHNVKVLVKGKDRCTLLVHPDDAARSGRRRRRSRPRQLRGRHASRCRSRSATR